MEQLWPDVAEHKASHSLDVHVSKLRHALAKNGRLQTHAPGYLLSVETGELDLHRFEQLAAEGREALARGQAPTAAERLRAALDLWAGKPLQGADLDGPGVLLALEEQRLGALEDRIDADLELGRHPDLVAELRQLVGLHPLRERLRGQLMLALYRCGRQAEALESYRQTRALFVEELGIEPSRAMQELERKILCQDSSLDQPRAVRVTLPAPVSSFVGRAPELNQLTELVLRSGVRLVTLTGPGGIGKTRLALQAASQLAGGYEHGVYFCDLAPLSDPGLVLDSISSALDARGDPQEHVGDKRMLLVLDNFEHVLESAPGVASLLRACPRLCVLATSRERLRLSGEHIFDVPPMTEKEALQLFAERAEAASRHLTHEGLIADICQRLDHLPLAIELAAAGVTEQALLEDLETHLSLLAKGPRDAPARQHTLRATIDWSYELLEDDEQLLFRRLSVFVGGCALAAAQEICEAELDTLRSLAEKSLLRRSEDRYWMLETIREYATDRLEPSDGVTSLRRRHADWYIAFVESAEPEMWNPEQQAWSERLDAEHDNVRAALAWCLDDADWDSAVRLAGAMEPYWETRGHIAEGRRWLERALTAGHATSGWIRAKALFGASRLLQFTDYEAERALLEESVALYRQAADARGLVFALTHLAQATGRLGDRQRAEVFFEEAVAIARSLDDRWLLAMALNNFGCALTEEGEYASAHSLVQESLAVRRALGEKRGVAVTLTSVGELALAQNDPAAARPAFEESLALARELGNLPIQCWALCGLGLAAVLGGDLAGANALLTESIALADQLGDHEMIIECLAGLAGVASGGGEIVRAVRLWGASEALRAKRGTPLFPAVKPLHDNILLPRFRAEQEPDLFAAEWSYGESLALAEAVAYALGHERKGDPPPGDRDHQQVSVTPVGQDAWGDHMPGAPGAGPRSTRIRSPGGR
jgi:predicted ATPase/DNA-binding SARP family transcriptional activator